LLTAAALCLPLVARGQAADEHAAHHPQDQSAATSGEPATAPPESGARGGTAALEQGIKRLQALMAQINQTSDPAEREKLLHQHMAGMLEQMKLMRQQGSGMKMAMMGDGMKGGDKKDGAANKPDKGDNMMGGGMMGGGMMKMHKMMENRIQMLELMLEQAIEHAHASEAAEH
jgi:hypothetical protein